MDVYQLSDLINGVNNNIIAGQAVFITIVSAYLIVAYSVGKDLTFYQVCFINFIFLLMTFVGYYSMEVQLELVYNYSSEKLALLGLEPRNESLGDVVGIVFLGMRLIITLGALIFMWQARRPAKKVQSS